MEIYSSKKKITFIFAGCLVFVGMGSAALVKPDYFLSVLFQSPLFVKIVGFVVLLFFGFGACVTATKLFDKKPALIIDEFGITYNMSTVNIGLIEWADIKGFKRVEILSTKILLVQLVNAKKYISRAKSPRVRKNLEFNEKNYGSPISIVAGPLAIGFEELETTLKEAWKRQRNLS